MTKMSKNDLEDRFALLVSELYDLALQQSTYDDPDQFNRFGMLLTQLEALYTAEQERRLPNAVPSPEIIQSVDTGSGTANV